MRYLTKQMLRIAILAGVLLAAGCAVVPTSSTNDAGEKLAPAADARRYNEAQILIELEDYAGAAQILSEFVAANPQYPAAATSYAQVLRKLSQNDQALSVLEQSLALHAEFAPGWNEVGILQREAGEFDLSEAAYMKAVTVNPDYALAHFNLGILLDLYQGRQEQALMHYERYQELAGSDDKQVQRWIADLSRRIQRATQAAQSAQ